MTAFYILDGKTPMRCHDFQSWGEWMATHSRRVAHDEIDGIIVSTVFLAIDHNFHDRGPPILFETLVFVTEGETGEMLRYATWDYALLGHVRVVKKVREYQENADDRAVSLMGHLRAVFIQGKS